MLTHDRANELLRYEPSSGKLFWKKTTTNRVKVGDEAAAARAEAEIKYGFHHNHGL